MTPNPAQVTTIPSDQLQFIQKLGNREMPSQADFLAYLTSPSMGMLQAILLLACGLVYLLYGWKVFKVLVVVNATLLGTIVGVQVGAMIKGGGGNMSLYCGIAGAVIFGALSWPLMKYAVSIMGGLAGSFLGYAIWNYGARMAGVEEPGKYAWAGALIGLVALGLLAFIIFRVTVVTFTAFQGAMLTVAGILAIALKYDMPNANIRTAFTNNPHLLPLLILVPAVIGFAFQYAANNKGGKKPAPASG